MTPSTRAAINLSGTTSLWAGLGLFVFGIQNGCHLAYAAVGAICAVAGAKASWYSIVHKEGE